MKSSFAPVPVAGSFIGGIYLARTGDAIQLELGLTALTPVEATVTALAILAVLLLFFYLRGRSKRSTREESQGPAGPPKFDTTLGAFHDMREALRPLEHTRAASRRDPDRGQRNLSAGQDEKKSHRR